MNRPGAGPQSMRGIPGGFGGQQQIQQPGRGSSNRMPNGSKIGAGNNSNSGWAFGSGIPMGGGGAGAGSGVGVGGLSSASRQHGNNLSFAQSLSGSSPATPLDLSDFPSLSSNAQQSSSAAQAPMWTSAGSRNVGGPGGLQRNPGAPLSSQQSQRDDLFASSSRLGANPGAFRFGNHGNVTPSQSQTNAADDFPPLNRSVNGEIGQERNTNLMSNLGFGSQQAVSATNQSNNAARASNGLLNALSANARSGGGGGAADARSPIGIRSREGRDSLADDDLRSRIQPETAASQSPLPETISQPGPDPRAAVLGAIGASANQTAGGQDESAPPVEDPLVGMPPIDKWGIKGLRTLMQNHPDYNALITGMNPAELGLDIQSSEMISTQIFSLFDDIPPRPPVPDFQLPECYKVGNVGPIENKIGNFNEETLMWIFYSCPGDIKQHLAAIELNNRNWRWHKKHQIWLTKDDMMMPQVLGPQHERGYYVIWDTKHWRKDRREFTLSYQDLDTNPLPNGAAM